MDVVSPLTRVAAAPCRSSITTRCPSPEQYHGKTPELIAWCCRPPLLPPRRRRIAREPRPWLSSASDQGAGRRIRPPSVFTSGSGRSPRAPPSRTSPASPSLAAGLYFLCFEHEDEQGVPLIDPLNRRPCQRTRRTAALRVAQIRSVLCEAQSSSWPAAVHRPGQGPLSSVPFRSCEDSFDYVRLSSSWTRSSSLRDLSCRCR
nr:uncharacterized protein LOC109780193 isoform X2 [Aegilops tauschii subsp. strangulata]